MLPSPSHSGVSHFIRLVVAVAGAFGFVALILHAFTPAQVAFGETEAVTLLIDKLGPNVISVNEPISYTIQVTNTSGQTLNNVVITDTWNWQLYDGAYTTGGAISVTSFVIVTQPTKYAQWTLAPLATGASGFIQFTMVVTPQYQPRYNFGPTVLGNSAVITTSTPSITAGNDNVDTLILGPVLRITKTFTPTRPRAGRLLTYTFLVENLNRFDAITATNVVITERWPSNALFYNAYPPGTFVYDQGTRFIQWTVPGEVPVSSTTRVTLTVRVTPTFPYNQQLQNPKANCGVYADAAPFTIPCTTDVNLAPDEAFEKVTQATIPPAQSGTVSKTFPNRILTYTVYVYNPFDTDVTGMLVTDTLPTVNLAFSLVTETFQYSGLLSASPPGLPTVYAQGARTVVWELPTIGAWEVYTFAFQAHVPTQMRIDDNQLSKRYQNQVGGSYAGIFIATNQGSQDNSMMVDVVPQARPFKVVTPTTQFFGLPVTYTLTISNGGPTTIRDIEITDVLPTSVDCAFTYDGFVSGTPPLGALPGDTMITWAPFTLTAYAQTTLATFRAIAIGGDNRTCFNTVQGYSPDTFINRWTNLAPVVVKSPFAYNKTVAPSRVVLGGSIQYAVTEFNIGGIDATMNGFTDVLPLGFYHSGNPIYTDFSGMPRVLQKFSSNQYQTTFPVDVISTSVPCDQLPRVIYQAPGTLQLGIVDPPHLVGIWSNSQQVAGVDVHPQARVYKSSNLPGALPGEIVTFTIVLSNNTGLPITGVRVTDTLPGTSPNFFTFGGMVLGDPPVSTVLPNIVWDGQTIPANGTLTLIFRSTAPTLTGNYFNNVKASSTDLLICVPKLTPALFIPVKLGLIEVNKSATPRVVNPFGQFLYDISLKNIGPYTITLARFTDTLPGVSGFTWKFDGMQLGTGDPAPVSTNPPAWANLTIGQDKTLRLRFYVRAGSQAGDYPNLLTLAPLAGYMTASLPARWGLTRTNNFTGTPVTVVPGVGVIKEVNPEAQLAGQTVVYTITLVNLSASGQPINGVRITDTLPSGFTYEAMLLGSNPVLTSPLVWSVPSVSYGEANKLVLVFRARIGVNQPTGTYYNRVAASAAGTSIAPTGDIAPVAVFGLPVLNLSKSVEPASVIAGRVVTYTATLVNIDANDPVTGARITDTLPPGFTFAGMVSGPAPASTSPQVVWTDINVPATAGMTLVFRASVASSVADGTYYNQLDGSSSIAVFQGSGPVAPVVVAAPRFDVQVSKSDGALTNTVGGTAVYTIRYTNTLNTLNLIATNAVLTETFSPAAYLIADAPGWNLVAPGVYTRSLGDLPAGATGEVTFALQIDPNIPEQYLGISNTVQIGAAGPADVPEAFEQPSSNNTFTDIDTIRGADLAVIGIGMLPGSARQGQPATFVVTVTNLGIEATKVDPTVGSTDTSGWFWVDLYMKPLAQVPNAATLPSRPHDRYRSYCLDTENVPCTPQQGPGWQLWSRPFFPAGALAPGQSITVTFSPVFPANGPHYMYAQADIEWPTCAEQASGYYCGSADRGRIREADEQNNIAGPLIVNVQAAVYMPIVRK